MAPLVAAFARLVLGRRVRPLPPAAPVLLAIVATAAAPASRALPVPAAIAVAVPIPAAVVAAPGLILVVALAGVSAAVGFMERTTPRAPAVEPHACGAGRRRRLVAINPASSLEMDIARVREALHHGFRALGCVQRNVGDGRWRRVRPAYSALVLPQGSRVRGAFPVALRLLTTSFLPGVIAEGASKLVDIGIGVCFSAALIIALDALIRLLCLVVLVIPVAASVSLLVAPTAVPVSVPTASTPTAEPVLVIPAIVIELVLVAIITLIESCLETRVKRAIITIAHARSAWMIVIILADIP